MNLHVGAGTTDVCVTEPGVYTFSGDACFKFSKRSVLRFDTSKPAAVELVVAKYRVSGAVSSTVPVPAGQVVVDITTQRPGKKPTVSHHCRSAMLLHTGAMMPTRVLFVWLLSRRSELRPSSMVALC